MKNVRRIAKKTSLLLMMVMLVSMLGLLTGCGLLPTETKTETEVSGDKDDINDSNGKDINKGSDSAGNDNAEEPTPTAKPLPTANELMAGIDDNFGNYEMSVVLKASAKSDGISMLMNLAMDMQASKGNNHVEASVEVAASGEGETFEENSYTEMYTSIEDDWSTQYVRYWSNTENREDAVWEVEKSVYIPEDNAVAISDDALTKIKNGVVEEDGEYYVVTGELTAEDFEELITQMGLKDATGITTACTAKFNTKDNSFHSVEVTFNCNEKVDIDGVMLNIDIFTINLTTTDEVVVIPKSVIESAEKNNEALPTAVPTPTISPEETADGDWYESESALANFLASYDFNKNTAINNTLLTEINMYTDDWNDSMFVTYYEHVYNNIIYSYTEYDINTASLSEEFIDITYTTVSGSGHTVYNASQTTNSKGTTTTEWQKTVADEMSEDNSVVTQFAMANIEDYYVYDITYKGVPAIEVWGDLSPTAVELLCDNFPYGDAIGAKGEVSLIFTQDGMLLYSKIGIEIPQAQVDGLEYVFTDVDYDIITDYLAIDAVRIPDYVLRATGDMEDTAPEWVESMTDGYWERTGELEWLQEAGDVTVFLNGKDDWYYDNTWSGCTRLYVDDPAIDEEGAYEVAYEQLWNKISEMSVDNIVDELSPYGIDITIDDICAFTCNGRTGYYYVDTQWQYWKDFFVLQDIGGENFLRIEIRVNDDGMSSEEAHSKALEFIQMFVINI